MSTQYDDNGRELLSFTTMKHVPSKLTNNVNAEEVLCFLAGELQQSVSLTASIIQCLA